VHNDLWDFDLPMAPTLIDFPSRRCHHARAGGRHQGRSDLCAGPPGKPLTKVEDIAVKPGSIPAKICPTQPLSVGMPQIGTRPDRSRYVGRHAVDQLMCRIKFKSMRYEGLFTAPDTDVSLSFPGSLGGMNWGGLSADPANHLIFVNDMRLGLWVQMMPQKKEAAVRRRRSAQHRHGPGAAGRHALCGDQGPLHVAAGHSLPEAAVRHADRHRHEDPASGLVPVGTVQDTGPMGIKMRMPMPVGLPTLGGTLATQGGLVFFAGTQDYYLRAWDSATGKEIWKSRLPVGSQGGPMSYKSPKTGKQYVVISAGGARQSPDRGDYVIAYALPDGTAR
jgi:quinate dehydrogenase (quinone)